MSDFDNNYESGVDAYGSADVQFSDEPVKTPALAYVALVLPIVAIICFVVSCCCFPILLTILAFILSALGVVLNFIAGKQMKNMGAEESTFIKVTRVVEIIIAVLMFFGIGAGIVNKIWAIKMMSDPNSSYNQLINQLTGGITLLK